MNIAAQLDQKATLLAEDYLRTEGALLSVLIEMRRKRVFPLLNYSGIYDYCERKLRPSRRNTQTGTSVGKRPTGHEQSNASLLALILVG